MKVYYCAEYDILAMHDEANMLLVVDPGDSKFIKAMLNNKISFDAGFELIGEL